MKAIIPVALLAATFVHAQSFSPSAPLESPAEPQKNRVGVNYRFGWNARADFKNLGGFAGSLPAQTDPGPATGGGQNRTYDDGYVRVDNTGNNHGEGYANTTWYWGYVNAGQVASDGWHLNFSSASSSASSAPGAVSRNNKDDGAHGCEVFFNRELFRNEKWRWGVEAAVGFASLTIRDGRAFTADVTVDTTVLHDAYAVPGNPDNPSVPVILPAAPYSGSYDGFGVGYTVISDSPTRTFTGSSAILPGGASITGKRRLDADLWGFRLGPYVEIPLADKWTLLFSGGLALANVDSEFRFSETVSVPGYGSVYRSGKGSDDEWLAGIYAAGNVAYALTERWSLMAGFQYQNVGDTAQTVAGKRAKLDLGELFLATVGVSYGF